VSKTKKSYNDKYNGRDDDEEEVVYKRSSHKEYRQNLRKNRALKTRNIEEFVAIELEEEGDYAEEEYIPFYNEEDDEPTNYIIGVK